MDIRTIDLNLLRLFDAVHRLGSVSRAAEALALSQPAASQGLTRLRHRLHDALFTRAPGGVRPTPRADRLAPAVRQALATLEQALAEPEGFDPTRSQRVFRLHLSDIGEARFLPELMAALRERAPAVGLETMPLPRESIAAALDQGRIDIAIGFLPMVQGTRRLVLLKDRYVVLLRDGHPLARRPPQAAALRRALRSLEFVAVRSHADTLRLIEAAGLNDRVRLVSEHFMVLPAIVRHSDLAVVMPRNIAQGFEGCTTIEPPWPGRDFTVALHWSRRFEDDAGHRWLRELVQALFRERG